MNAGMTNRKRFYKAVDISEAADGFSVLLDQRAVRSPGGAALLLPTRPLADAVAEEWDGQGDEISPVSMPQFSLAVTVVDRVTPQRSAILDELAAYGGNDLLCYHDSDDAGLAARQQDGWMPWISWAQTTLGPICKSPPESCQSVRRMRPAVRLLTRPPPMMTGNLACCIVR